MLSYNDIINYKFEKAGFGGGYRPEDVDKFTMRIATDYQKLEAEKAELEQKLMALAEKVEEYREDEESLRAALLGAQKLGDSIIRESKQKSELMLNSARTEAAKIVDTARRQIEREQGALTKLQKEVANFKNRMVALYKQHLDLICSIPGPDVGAEAQDMINRAKNPHGVREPQREQAMREQAPQEAVMQMPPLDESQQQAAVMEEMNPGIHAARREEEEMPTEMPVEAPASFRPAEPAPQPQVHESRFGELKFGDGYDLSRN